MTDLILNQKDINLNRPKLRLKRGNVPPSRQSSENDQLQEGSSDKKQHVTSNAKIDGEKHVKVDIPPFYYPLSQSTKMLIVPRWKANPAYRMAPFYDEADFNPITATDEELMIQILRYEMDHIDRKPKWSWKDMLSNALFRIIHLGQASDEEYIKRFPWDQFYEMQLYEFANKPQNRGKINFDMIPKKDQNHLRKYVRRNGTEYSFVPLYKN